MTSDGAQIIPISAPIITWFSDDQMFGFNSNRTRYRDRKEHKAEILQLSHALSISVKYDFIAIHFP
ncbi:MAG: hypothetical protein CMK59_10630 [Proteobacteria bacterium]|nr:hypothetical protein [Pseudomonadota bacterium]